MHCIVADPDTVILNHQAVVEVLRPKRVRSHQYDYHFARIWCSSPRKDESKRRRSYSIESGSTATSLSLLTSFSEGAESSPQNPGSRPIVHITNNAQSCIETLWQGQAQRNAIHKYMLFTGPVLKLHSSYSQRTPGSSHRRNSGLGECKGLYMSRGRQTCRSRPSRSRSCFSPSSFFSLSPLLGSSLALSRVSARSPMGLDSPLDSTSPRRSIKLMNQARAVSTPTSSQTSSIVSSNASLRLRFLVGCREGPCWAVTVCVTTRCGGLVGFEVLVKTGVGGEYDLAKEAGLGDHVAGGREFGV